MAIDLYLSFLMSYSKELLVCAVATWLMAEAIKAVFRAVRSPIPGPRLAKLTGLWIRYQEIKDSGKTWKTTHRLHEKYGPIVQLGPKEVSVCHGDALRTIYHGPRGLDGSDAIAVLRQYGSDNLVSTVDSDLHIARRRAVLGLYTAPNIASPALLDIFNTYVDHFINAVEEQARLSPSRTVTAFEWIKWATSDIMLHLIYGKDPGVNLLTNEKSRSKYKELLSTTAFTFSQAVIALFPNSLGRILEIAKPESPLSALGMKLVEQGLESEGLQSQNSAASTSHIQQLGTRFKNHGACPVIPDKEYIASDCLDHFLAGNGTTTDLLSALIFHLSLPENCSHQERLRQELHDAGIVVETQPSLVTLQQLPFLNRVLRETLRTDSPIPFSLPRVLNKDKSLEVMGFKIDPETQISSQAYTLHRDPTIFPDPESWNPDRWDVPTKSPEYRLMNRNLWPFGSGPRMCTGMNVAWAMSRLITARIYSTFKTSLDTVWFDENGKLLPEEKRKDLYPSTIQEPIRFERCS
ncbi:hypothetical protein FQN57_003416 [Myotisia sp. PD_48]|nr:hypothetical protein FQN57_003416 [Myotisia sp. PD_48]